MRRAIFSRWQRGAPEKPGGLTDQAARSCRKEPAAALRRQGGDSRVDQAEAPCPFLDRKFPICSIIRPTETKGAAIGAVNALTADGLFIGQTPEFKQLLNDLATDADAARRKFSKGANTSDIDLLVGPHFRTLQGSMATGNC
jgi:hypothetical protein